MRSNQRETRQLPSYDAKVEDLGTKQKLTILFKGERVVATELEGLEHLLKMARAGIYDRRVIAGEQSPTDDTKEIGERVLAVLNPPAE